MGVAESVVWNDQVDDGCKPSVRARYAGCNSGWGMLSRQKGLHPGERRNTIMLIGKTVSVALLFCGAELVCGGCVSRVAKTSYPETWLPARSAPTAQCPRLAGHYVNAGEAAPGTKDFFCGSHSNYRATWCGETALSQNLGNIASGDWVELRQPNDDTLIVVSSDPTVAVQELHHKNGDFSCSGNGLERQLHVSASSIGDNSSKASAGRDTYNAIAGAGVAVLYASGGVRTLTRRFNLASDGSLVMAVTQSESGAMLLIPYHEVDETFVRWVPVAPSPDGLAPAPAVIAAASPPGDLPSDHVGIFEATNGAMWSKVKVTNLDGLPVNTYARLPGVPIALEPGRHWIQVGAATTHMIPPRDIDTKYAFEIEAVAGHRYRILSKPPSCLTPGGIDAALASSSIYHSRLSIIDEVAGTKARSIDVQALCVSASSFVCTPPEAAAPEPAEGAHCVRLQGWKRGYNGVDAGPVPPQ